MGDDEDWSQRARLLWSLDRTREAVHDYLKGMLQSFEGNGGAFSVAYYLKEMTVRRGAVEELLKEALRGV